MGDNCYFNSQLPVASMGTCAGGKLSKRDLAAKDTHIKVIPFAQPPHRKNHAYLTGKRAVRVIRLLLLASLLPKRSLTAKMTSPFSLVGSRRKLIFFQ